MCIYGLDLNAQSNDKCKVSQNRQSFLEMIFLDFAGFKIVYMTTKSRAR